MGEKLRELQKKRRRVQERLTEVGEMRQGTLTERYRKCGKPGCRCASEEKYKEALYMIRDQETTVFDDLSL